MQGKSLLFFILLMIIYQSCGIIIILMQRGPVIFCVIQQIVFRDSFTPETGMIIIILKGNPWNKNQLVFIINGVFQPHIKSVILLDLSLIIILPIYLPGI